MYVCIQSQSTRLNAVRGFIIFVPDLPSRFINKQPGRKLISMRDRFHLNDLCCCGCKWRKYGHDTFME